MKFLLDFFPIVLFFIVYKAYGLNEAIIAMIAATLMQILYTKFRTNKFEKMQIITLVILVVFGGLTIYINNPAFIMWKVSVLYVVFALAILLSIFSQKTLLERMLSKELKLPQHIWKQLTYLWGGSFIGIAIINGYFVKTALTSRDLFFNKIPATDIQLTKIKCFETYAVELCNNAQIAESSWVNFKLFGTMGLTIILLIITVIAIKKYIKQ